MVFAFCTLSDNALYLYQVLWNISQKGFSNYYADNIFIVKFAKGHNRQKCR